MATVKRRARKVFLNKLTLRVLHINENLIFIYVHYILSCLKKLDETRESANSV